MDQAALHIVLETSVVIAYISGEPEGEGVGELLSLAEADCVQVFVSRFAWDEVSDAHWRDQTRLPRLKTVARDIPKVARLGEWVLGADILGRDDSGQIERGLPQGTSRADREQFLSYATRAEPSFFVTTDKDFLKASARKNVLERFGFHAGTPRECLAWLEGQRVLDRGP